MAKFDTTQAQLSALRTIQDFDINKVKAALRVDDPLEYAKLGPGSADVSENMTVIGKSMVVDGSISTSSPVYVKGTVNGNIKTTSDIGIDGLVNGDVEADNINFSRAAIKGNSKAAKEISVSDQSVIIGDVEGGTIVVNGKIKGNLSASNSVLFKKNALIVGKIVAGGLNMEDGARINATITLTTNCNDNAYDESEFDMEV